MNLAALWNYMQFDLEADKFSQEMRQSPKRKTLVRQSEQLKEFQASNAKIDSEIEAMNARLAELASECERLSKLLEEYQAGLGDVEAMSEEEQAEKLKTIEKLYATIDSYDKELQKLVKESTSAEKRQMELKKRAAQLKQEYDKLKAEYDVEFPADKKKLALLRQKAEKEATRIEAADLERYKEIKQHVTPPIAKLLNNQCTGCFMALSIGTLREIKTNGEGRVCDNCGRLLFTVDE